MSNGMLHAAFEHVGPFSLLSVAGCHYHGIRHFLHAVRLQSAHFQHFAAQLLLQLLCIDRIPILTDDVHHIDGDHRRDPQLQQLCGQIQVSFDIAAVHNIQDGIRLFIYQILPGDHFLECVRGQ